MLNERPDNEIELLQGRALSRGIVWATRFGVGVAAIGLVLALGVDDWRVFMVGLGLMFGPALAMVFSLVAVSDQDIEDAIEGSLR